MFVFVLLLGIVAVVVGGLSCAYGFLINEFSLGNTLLISGAIGVIGGLVLIGVAGVIRQLRRIGDGLATLRLPAVRSFRDLRQAERVRAERPRRSLAPEAVPPALEPHGIEPQLDAVPPVRPEAPLLDPFAQPAEPALHVQPVPEPATLSGAEPPPVAPSVEPQLPLELESVPLSPDDQEPSHGSQDERREPTFEQPPEPRQEAMPESHDEAPAEARRSPFDTIWPRRGRTDRTQSEPEAAVSHGETVAPTEPEPVAAAAEPTRGDAVAESDAASAAPHPVSILKSGVVDGMAYTLYSDGSIEAELPSGTIRFASINELREHLEQTH